jgi:hypothetical protein
MEGMLTIVPDPWIPGSVVVADGNDEGVETDISVSVTPGDGPPPFTVRTLLRTGTRIHASGLVRGVATDAVAIAHLAASSLLLQAIPSGLPPAETRSAMHASEAAADTLAQDHARWSFRPMVLDDTSFALRFRILGQGFVAHADLGDCVVAAWGTGALPPELNRVQKVESASLPCPE